MEESGKVYTAQSLTWDNFTIMPHEEQEEVLKYITDRFRVGTSAIANDLFHISQHTLYRYIQRNALEYPTSRGGRVPEAVMQEWKKWVSSLSAPKSPETRAVTTALPAPANADDAASSVGDVVRAMHDLYGRIRVTISIEPT